MQKLNFSQLTSGDRFVVRYNKKYSLWTKINHDSARKHSIDSINLKKRGYGYIGDAFCYFAPYDKVLFVPVDLETIGWYIES